MTISIYANPFTGLLYVSDYYSFDPLKIEAQNYSSELFRAFIIQNISEENIRNYKNSELESVMLLKYE